MTEKRKVMFVIPPQRALVPYLPPMETTQTEQTRNRRRFLFGVDQALNTLLVGAVLALFAFAPWLLRTNLAPSATTVPAAAPVSTKFVTAAVTKGDLSVRVSASGTVEPVRLVEVSTELSGTIQVVHIDNNDLVKAGQLLAELDPSTLKNEFLRAEAQVAAQKARVKEAQAASVAAGKDLARKNALARQNLAPAREIDNANATALQTKASIEALTAELKAAEANLNIAKANLEKVRIVSPIDGIVLRRNVEPGQTVAASLQSPVLFRIAQDLDRMQIRVDVDEADALRVSEGQPATFNVQALRDQQLEARVEKIYMGPEVVQGVVTYKAVLSFDNSELKLKPGMSAMAEIYVEDVQNGLLVPNAALRFSPPEEAPSEGVLAAGSALLGLSSKVAPSKTTETAQHAGGGVNTRKLYIDDGGIPRPVEVEIGATDGTMTQIVSGPIKAGQRVIVDIAGGA